MHFEVCLIWGEIRYVSLSFPNPLNVMLSSGHEETLWFSVCTYFKSCILYQALIITEVNQMKEPCFKFMNIFFSQTAWIDGLRQRTVNQRPIWQKCVCQENCCSWILENISFCSAYYQRFVSDFHILLFRNFLWEWKWPR